ncbi:MAG: NADH-quinone oxidoreductase subunit K [Chloroflexi bacterium]|nr:NADH-quinone oxidoreductase subunit K [Chloroflexota bacterium]
MSLSIPVIVAIAVLGLLGIGLYGVLISRNLIKVIIGLQIMVKGAMLALVLAGRMNGQLNTAASLALTVIVVDTIIAVVGLALAVQIRRTTGTLDVKSLSNLKR